ncbi:MAG: hypothetical protein RR945_11440, partial [Erysipelotrichaceae bacterium]
MNDLKKHFSQYIKYLKTSKSLMAAAIIACLIVITGIYNIMQFQSYFPFRYTIIVGVISILLISLAFLLTLKGGKVAL